MPKNRSKKDSPKISYKAKMSSQKLSFFTEEQKEKEENEKEE